MSDVVERLRELLAKATPGLWKAHERPHSGTITGPTAASFVYVGDDPDDNLQRVLRCYTTVGFGGVAERQANLQLIVEAINALPDLLDEILSLRAQVASAVEGERTASASYDETADVLYVGIPEPVPAVCHDAKLDCLARLHDGKIVGVTIVDFKEQVAAAIRKGNDDG